MGVLHEIFVAIGVVLTLSLACSAVTIGREYLRTGHFPLAVIELVHEAAGEHGAAGLPHPAVAPRHCR